MSPPLVSIGMPVFNGEKYLESALRSLLEQDYGNFELIISDNASTDRTPQICTQCAENDKRVQYHRNASNVGAENFNRVFRLSRGDYFMWAAHDDFWHPTYVTRCLEGLLQDRNIVLCASTIQFIDEFGLLMPEHKWRHVLGGGYNRLQTRSLDLRARVRELTKTLNWYAIYGLIRADVLRRTRLYTATYGGDVILLMELLFHGETFILDEPLFRYRWQPRTFETSVKGESATGAKGTKLGPYTGLVINLLKTIEDSDFSADTKSILSADLLDNVIINSPQWAYFIRLENPSIDQTRGLHLRRAQIRDLIRGGLSAQRSAEPTTD